MKTVKINSVKALKIGDIIKHREYPRIWGEVVEIDGSYIKYKDVTTELIQPIHVDNITEFEIVVN